MLSISYSLLNGEGRTKEEGRRKKEEIGLRASDSPRFAKMEP
jgi:hypothetical protein